MAKTTGPLFSLEARGALGGSIIYNQSSGRSTSRRWSKPSGPASQAQITRRDLYKAGISAWKLLSPAEKEELRINAIPLKISGFNLFMRAALQTPQQGGTTFFDGGSTSWDNGTTFWD